MDQELKEYFDRRFGEMAEFRRDVDARFEESRAQMAEFRRDVDARFEESRAQMAEFRRDVDARFEQVDNQVRRVHVMVEDVRGLVQTVAEGVVAVRESQQRHTAELKEDVGEVRDLLTASYRRVAGVEGGG